MTERGPKDRRVYQHQQYILRKHSGCTLKEAQTEELIVALKLGIKKCQREKRELNHYTKQRPGLREYLDYMTQPWAEETLSPDELDHEIKNARLQAWRKISKKAFAPETWAPYYNSDVWKLSGQYLEPLWDSKHKKQSRKDIKEFILKMQQDHESTEEKDVAATHEDGYDVTAQ
jgi:hypothetical protein